MAKQLVFTSVLRGLDPGRSGYCTVARHRDLRERLVPEIERLSAYHHVNYTYGDGVLNPVVMAFRTITLGETRYHIFTRIVDAGFDYSRRSNYLAHHLIVEEKEITGGITPADIFLGWNGWLDKWEGEPRFYGPADDVSLADIIGASQPPLPAQNWAALVGDAGAAAAPLDVAPRQGFAFAVRPGSERLLLSLYRESAALLPVHERWKLGFTTYLQETDRPNEFRWAGHWPDHQPISASGWTVLDLRQAGLVPAPAGLAAERARVGDKPKLVPPPAPALTPPKAEAVPKKWDLAKPPGASAAPRSRTVILSQEDVPTRSWWKKWPVMAAGVLVILGLLGGGGYFFIKTDEETVSRSKDRFAGESVEKKAAVLAAELAAVKLVQEAATPTPVPTPEIVLKALPSEPNTATLETPPVPLEAPKIKTYVAWRDVGVKLIPEVLRGAVEKNVSIKILKQEGGWIDALAVEDSYGLKIGPAMDIDSYNILIKNEEIKNIPPTLNAVIIGDNRLVFVKKEVQAALIWPNNPEISIALNNEGRASGLAELVLSGSGIGPEFEYRLALSEDLKKSVRELCEVNGVGVLSGLGSALNKSINRTDGSFLIYSRSGLPGEMLDKNGVNKALSGFSADLNKLNHEGRLGELEKAKADKLSAVGKAIGLPYLRTEAESLAEVSKIQLNENGTSGKLSKKIVDVMLGADYKSIGFSDDDKRFTVEELLRKAESLYGSNSKNLSAKAVVDKLITILPKDSSFEQKNLNSIAWASSIRQSIIDYQKASKAYDDAKNDTANYNRIEPHFNRFDRFWRSVMAREIKGAEVYFLMEGGAQVKLGKIQSTSVK